MRRPFPMLLVLASLCALASAQEPRESLIGQYCVECHGGDAVKGKLDLTRPEPDAVSTLWRWSRLRERVLAGEMPPADAAQPTAADKQVLVASIDTLLAHEVPTLPVDPGRVTVRRLSSTHWRNAVRDLFGVEVDTTPLPSDDLGYGFDSIGDALTFSTLHLEQYLSAARAVSLAVLPGEDREHPAVQHFAAESMQVDNERAVVPNGDEATLLSRATIAQQLRLPRDGEYRLHVRAGGDQAGDEPPKMSLRWDGNELATIEVAQRPLRTFTITAPFGAGQHELAITFLNDYYAPQDPDPAQRDRNLHVAWAELEGPIDARPVPEQQAWLAPVAKADGSAALRSFVRTLLPRVWRRTVGDDEVSRVVRAGEQRLGAGRPLIEAQRLVLQAALTSPHFLFRIEVGAVRGVPGSVAAVSSTALASRLSFFLWASAPDPALLELAQKGALATPQALAAQVDRMLADGRAESLATDFAAQWLELKNLRDRTPDAARFPQFDDELCQSMRRETELVFAAIVREGRDVRELLDCDFTYVNARLAGFYGYPGPEPHEGFVRVQLPADSRERGGVLGHASVLTVTSSPTRTSPVKRGKWVLDNLLGQGPPPPPPGNDSFANEGAVDSSRSLREQMQQHRQRSDCAVCHLRMDAMGSSLERYDAIGRRRDHDSGGAIDCSGQLPDGRRIDGLAELKRLLVGDGAYVRTLTHKLFVYGVGRELRPVDRLRLDQALAARLVAAPVTMRDLVRLIVADPAFWQRVVPGS